MRPHAPLTKTFVKEIPPQFSMFAAFIIQAPLPRVKEKELGYMPACLKIGEIPPSIIL
jgi:hypothetical protein